VSSEDLKTRMNNLIGDHLSFMRCWEESMLVNCERYVKCRMEQGAEQKRNILVFFGNSA